ncbi:MAG: hypothetical protein JWM32_1704 [Verrucomicrobia bacterium]|nr:hypothetical protein [Verrucomicrobiota bacterium]
MTSSKKTTQRGKPVKVLREDRNHHLVANRGFWWVCCSINATSRTKEKLSYSLRTKDVEVARVRRDLFLFGLHGEGLEVRLRRQHGVVMPPVSEIGPHRAAILWKQRVSDVLERALAAGEGIESEAIVPAPTRKKTRRRKRRDPLFVARL